jgi:hypothetical protein
MLSAIIASVNEHIGIYLKEVFQILLSHPTTLDNAMVRLQEFANKFALNLYICNIDQNGIKFEHLYTTHECKGGKSSRAFLVFDKRYQTFYPFYVCDNNKIHTTFPTDDMYTLQLFQDSVSNYNWPSNGEVVQQLSTQYLSTADQQNNGEENTSTTDGNYRTQKLLA